MPVASTVFRLADRTLAIYSPIELDGADATALESLGEVTHILIPNALHHRFAIAATVRWPAARVHVADGARKKQPALRVDHELREPIAAWRGVLEIERIDGAPSIDEHVAFHRPSGTLACADLVFHITAPRNLRTRMVLAMMGVGGGRLAQSRVWRFARRDTSAARASIARILAWPIERIVPCHGEPFETDANGLVLALRRLLGRRVIRALNETT